MEEPKTCSRCKEVKDRAEFRRDRSRKDGLNPRCKKCHNETKHEWRGQKKNYQKYNQSLRGVARNLRSEHDFDVPTSLYWARKLFDSGTRCAICGLPTYLIEVYRARGWPWFLGRQWGAGSHPRLTLDHIVPGSNEGGFRLLCYACNTYRGALRMSDEVVLIEVRDKWRWFSGLRFLWWLNTSPGVGGRLHRSVRCEKRDAEFAAGARPEATPQ